MPHFWGIVRSCNLNAIFQLLCLGGDGAVAVDASRTGKKNLYDSLEWDWGEQLRSSPPSLSASTPPWWDITRGRIHRWEHSAHLLTLLWSPGNDICLGMQENNMSCRLWVVLFSFIDTSGKCPRATSHDHGAHGSESFCTPPQTTHTHIQIMFANDVEKTEPCSSSYLE